MSDPCVWVFVNPETNEHCGIIGAHVDDFLIAGDKSPHWAECIKTLLAAFRWTPFEENSFKQCGIQVTQNPDGSVTQHKKQYLSTMSEIELSKERALQPNSCVTEKERTELRALLGGLQWLVTQTRVDGSIDTNLLQSDVTVATAETLLAANKILRKLRQGPAELHTRKIQGELEMVAWSDASWANRKKSNSNSAAVRQR